VEIRLKTGVAGYDGKELTLSEGTKIVTRLVVWTAGISPSPLVSSLPCAKERDRVLVNACLQIPQWPGVWALGDCVAVPDSLNPGKYCPPTAQHATRQAAVVAANIVAEMRGQALRPFRFKTLGMLAAIGRRAGVAEILGVKFSGFIAWVLWRTIYLSKLPGLQKKVRVALDWALDLIFSKDIVQLPTLRSVTMSEPEGPPAGGTQKHVAGMLEPNESRQ
jgi:NADH dehydrogenase